MNRRLTLEDIGRLAGVSRATVSRVINNPGYVTPEIRERVQKVITETGYVPNKAARSLASARTHILGLIIPHIVQSLFSDPYFPALIQGVSQACNASEYMLTLYISHTKQEQQEIFRRAIASASVDGLIVTADMVSERLIPELFAAQIPFVYIGRPQTPDAINFVDVDNVAGAFDATRHLLRLGHRRIALITGPQALTANIDRRAGYFKAFADRGLAVDESLIIESDFSQAGGYASMQQLIPARPDAVFAASDTMALGALHALQDAGFRVPEDIALVGFDDLAPAVMANPPLTTIKQPVVRCGNLAVETLIEILAGESKPPCHTFLPTELVIRGTCGAREKPSQTTP